MIVCQLVDLEAPAHSAVGRPTVRVITSGTTAPPPTYGKASVFSPQERSQCFLLVSGDGPHCTRLLFGNQTADGLQYDKGESKE